MERPKGIIKVRDYLYFRSSPETREKLEILLEEVYQARVRGLFMPETDPNEPGPAPIMTIGVDLGRSQESYTATQVYLDRLMKRRPEGPLAAMQEGRE